MCENNIICEELQQCCNNPLFCTECNEYNDSCNCCAKPYKKHKCCCCKFMEKADQVEDIANEIKLDYSTIKSRIIGNENLIEENRDKISELESLVTGGVDLNNYYTKSQVDNQQQLLDLEIAKKADRTSLSTVATSGSYNDLSNKPTIPSTDGLASELYVRNYTYDKQTIDEKVAQGGTFDPTNYYTKSEIDDANDAYDTELNNKVDKVSGKSLSTNDYTTAEKNKLAGIAAGANVNVNADWNATSGDAKILNKPTIPSIEGLASEQYVSNYTYDKQTIDEKVAEGGTFDPTLYYNKTITDQRINTATSDMATKTWVGNLGYITTSDIPEGAAASTTTPKMDGTASVGTELAFARGDHRHPSDTTKVDKVSGKGLSTNDYTNAEKEKLASLDNVTESTVSDWGFTKNTGTYSKPSGGIPKTDLASSVQTSLGKADTALQSFTETDPTVPAWAKQASKPTYTASEVGALPANTQLFSGDYNDLTNKPTIPEGTVVDSALSKTSTHPVQNKVITEALENVGGNPDRSYDTTAHSGLGRKTLELKEGGSNVLTQEDFSDANTIYVIRYDFTLGEDITIPENCVLEFDGGSISGSYILTGTNTLFTGNITSKVNLAGTLANKEIYINEFLDNQSILDYQRINSVLSTLSYAKVNFDGNYTSLETESESLNRGIRLLSNVIYSGNGSIINYPNSKSLFIFNDAHNYDGDDYVENIVIDGFNFSCGLHSESNVTHHFATIALGRVKDCRISNCTFDNWVGDAIAAAYIFNPQRTAHVKGFTKNIVIDNCKFLGTGTGDNWKERNAVSVLDCDGFTISNCLFKDMGNPSQPSCIDFEPEKIDGVNVMNIKRVIVEGCNFLNVKAGVGNIAFVGNTVTTDSEYITIRNNTFKDGESGLRLSLDFKYFIDSNIFYSMSDPARIDSGISMITNNTFISCITQFLVGYSLNYPTVVLKRNTFKDCKGYEDRGFIVCHISGLLSCENNYIENCIDKGGDVKYGLITSIAKSGQEDSENNNVIFVDNIFVTTGSYFIGIYKTDSASVRKLKDLSTKIIGWDGTPGYYTSNMALDSTQITCKA